MFSGESQRRHTKCLIKCLCVFLVCERESLLFFRVSGEMHTSSLIKYLNKLCVFPKVFLLCERER